MASRPGKFDLIELRGRLKPFRLHWFSRLNSTNDHAAKLRRAGSLFAPALVLASKQLHGRGRGENVWHSPAGALTATFVLPIAEHLKPHQIPLIAGLAVRNALQEISAIDAIKLKWPNDLLHNDRKLGGLLCERLDGVDLIGVGINVNVSPAALPKSIRRKSTSLSQTSAKSFDMNDVVALIARHLHARLSRRNEQQFGAVLREYHLHDALFGRHVKVIQSVNSGKRRKPLSGTCVGLDVYGRLLVREERNRSLVHRVVSGHVSMR